MAVVPIESAVKHVLKKTSSLSTHDRIAFNFLEISVRVSSREHLDLPFAFRVRGVAMRIDFSRQEIRSRLLA